MENTKNNTVEMLFTYLFEILTTETFEQTFNMKAPSHGAFARKQFIDLHFFEKIFLHDW